MHATPRKKIKKRANLSAAANVPPTVPATVRHTRANGNGPRIHSHSGATRGHEFHAQRSVQHKKGPCSTRRTRSSKRRMPISSSEAVGVLRRRGAPAWVAG